jgi:hypothetical protein
VAYLPLAGRVDTPVEPHLLWLKGSRNPALWQVPARLEGYAP